MTASSILNNQFYDISEEIGVRKYPQFLSSCTRSLRAILMEPEGKRAQYSFAFVISYQHLKSKTIFCAVPQPIESHGQRKFGYLW